MDSIFESKFRLRDAQHAPESNKKALNSTWDFTNKNIEKIDNLYINMPAKASDETLYGRKWVNMLKAKSTGGSALIGWKFVSNLVKLAALLWCHRVVQRIYEWYSDSI